MRRIDCAVIATTADKRAEAEAFWRFSLRVYARPGIAAALLGLQDRAGHNVNLVLYGLWLAIGRGVRLDRGELTRARAAIAKIDRDVLLPLRNLRRALKGDADPDIQALRRRVLALEVAAERRVQARLATGSVNRKAKGNRAVFVAANLKLILGGDFAAPEAAVLRQAIADL
jgi:uncharacterized protein (TIGR02444 family)